MPSRKVRILPKVVVFSSLAAVCFGKIENFPKALPVSSQKPPDSMSRPCVWCVFSAFSKNSNTAVKCAHVPTIVARECKRRGNQERKENMLLSKYLQIVFQLKQFTNMMRNGSKWITLVVFVRAIAIGM